MMSQLHSFPITFLKDMPAKIVEIPYKNSDLSMFVLLPDDIDGLEKVKPGPSPSHLQPGGCVAQSCLIWASLPTGSASGGAQSEILLSVQRS